jgi:ribosomal protein S18 acetylase RimI-like enzyme
MDAMHLEVVRGQTVPDVDLPATTGWILEAGDPYLTWLHDGAERARAAVREGLRRDGSELSPRHLSSIRDGGRSVGGYIALGGRELAARRLADTARLMRATPVADRDHLRRRLEHARELFLPVDPEHLCLTKIGVVDDHRGRGLGRCLLEDFVRSGFDRGYDCLRLDVSSEHEPARRLYESRGFVPITSRWCEPLGAGYTAMTLSRSDA